MTISIKENISLKDFTTFHVGGPAKYLVEVQTPEEVLKAIEFAENKGIKILPLGLGSNTLISDKGFDGLVLINDIKGIELNEDSAVINSGENLHSTVIKLVNMGAIGFAKLGWIPGTIGGAIVGNAGAYGIAIGELVEEVSLINLNTKERLVKKAADCDFKYRSSIFKLERDLFVLSAKLKITKGDQDAISKEYAEIEKKRSNSLPKFPSCGCDFKNFEPHEFTKQNIEELKKLSSKTEEVLAKSKGKLPAGFVIEALGLKGKKFGGAKVSDEHANIIINTGEASARDIHTLISEIKNEVRSRLGLELKLEVEIIGDFS